MHRRLFLLSVLSLAGGATSITAAEPLAELESLYGLQARREGLVITVGSGGRTAKADFAFYVERKAGNASVAFARKRIDPCQSFAARRMDLAFTWAELGLWRPRSIALLNPLVAWRGPGA